MTDTSTNAMRICFYLRYYCRIFIRTDQLRHRQHEHQHFLFLGTLHYHLHQDRQSFYGERKIYRSHCRGQTVR